MASFQAEMVWKWSRKRENNNYRFVPFLPDVFIENSKNTRKKLQKQKNTIMASFQAKIVWKRPRKRENKNYPFVSLDRKSVV